MAAALSLAGVGTASADDGGQGAHCDNVHVKFSTDGGHHWRQDGMLTDPVAPTSIVVKLDGHVTRGCEYKISLATYKTEGKTWADSGTQSFLDVDHATLSRKNKSATLQVKGINNSVCFGQIDLYAGDTVYDGKTPSTALPHYPDSATPEDLITAWNGAYPDCDKNGGGDTPPSTGPSDSTPPSTGPSDSTTPPSGSDTTPPSTGPSDTTSPSPSTSASTGTPSTSPSSSAPAVGATTAPSGTPVAQPVSSTPTLAETGSNSSQTTTFIAAGAALVVIGAGAVVFTRRRNRGSNA
ncbi:LAETG motif-containing sortase-dependent surface protein [Streptomyces montanisoli]|nr:LAETG motif-containing sortase-dependent surface protein [Streptomyces montanisoli]